VLANVVLLRRAFSPLHHLTTQMARIDHPRPGWRVPAFADDREIVELTLGFNDMLDRLEDERTESWRRAVAAQEAERLRVAHELHDEIGQSLTAMKLLLAQVSKADPAQAGELLAESRELAESTLGEVREIARRLRPDTLAELGLRSALDTLAVRSGTYGDVSVRRSLAEGLPDLDSDTELVIYRIAQEGLTNVLRHSGAAHAALTLSVEHGRLVLEVLDDGSGLDGAPEGAGIQGMRERAAMVGGELSLGGLRSGGSVVRFTLPLEGGR